MPLEVNEIGIRMRVDDGEEESADDGKESGQGGCADSLDRDEIVDDCVRRILQILQRQRER